MISLGQNAQVEKSVIHVPQGRSGRIDKSATHDKAGSLFTYGIGTCNIVSFIGKERFSLIHIDTVIPLESSIDDELKWVGTGAQVIVLFREGRPVGKVIHHQILAQLAKNEVNPKVFPIDPARDGIQLFSEPVNTGTIHPHLLVHEKKSIPKNVRRHPQELKFTSVHKFEQLLLIGIFPLPQKKIVVYDGECWQQIPEIEFKPHCATEKERGYLSQLEKCADQPSDLLFTLAEIVEEMQEACTFTSHTAQDFSLSIEPHVENYVNRFNYVYIFRLKMLECVTRRQLPIFCERTGIVLTSDDRKFMKKILALVQNEDSNDAYLEVKKVIEEYTGVKTKAINDLIQEFVSYQENYLIGQEYAQLEEENLRGRKEAAQLAKIAETHFKAGEFEQAAEQFEKSLRLAQWHYDAGQTALAKYYSNYGIALKRLGQLERADRFLQIAHQLREQPKKN